MKPVYDIKFLSNDDFDNLPATETNGSDISDSLGFYNPFTNRVFIRHTAYPELNKYLLEHEFEHLLEDKPTDADENGIRHKKGKKFFKQILSPMLLGPLGAGALGHSMIPGGKTAGQKQSESQGIESPFGGLGGFGMGEETSTPSFGASTSPFSNQQTSQGSLNQGLNSQTINPLADPYAQYGRPSGRISF